MSKFKSLHLPKKPLLYTLIGLSLILIAALLLLGFNMGKDTDAEGCKFPSVYFKGEYRIGDGEWQEVVKDSHIPTTKGDVTLRGVFHAYFPGEELGPVEQGATISFYMDHIGITVYEDGEDPYVMDNENPLFGLSGCGQVWLGYTLRNGGETPLEIVIHNPHRFGNDTATDDLLSNLSIWANADLDRDIIADGNFQRNCATFFIVVAFIFLGTALYSAFLRIKNSKYIWLIGLSVLFAGGYMIFSSKSIYLTNNSAILNTTMLCICTIFYMLFISLLAAATLENTLRAGMGISAFLLLFDTAVLVAPVLFDVLIYDMLGIWALTQGVIGILLCTLLLLETIRLRKFKSVFHVVLMILFVAFALDLAGVSAGIWKGGMISSGIFVGAFMFALVFVLQVVPQNVVALSKAKESELHRVRLEAEKNAIEAELKENRIAIMLSQIQPHFIYNTLGTIERLCLKSPETAFELVRNFSLYLRGNFSELNSVAPIRFSDEIKHIQYYINIEKVRFPDMTINYQLEATDFVLPALSVQPLVENAIKHGLMRLESGGTVTIRSYETDTHFCIEVTDNGVGFDTSVQINTKEHVGLHNIRERLKAIVNGTLSIESTVNVGTTATIIIPKEESV